MFALGVELPRAELIGLSVAHLAQLEVAPKTLPCPLGPERNRAW
jgi:hypothetical protein